MGKKSCYYTNTVTREEKKSCYLSSQNILQKRFQYISKDIWITPEIDKDESILGRFSDTIIVITYKYPLGPLLLGFVCFRFTAKQ